MFDRRFPEHRQRGCIRVDVQPPLSPEGRGRRRRDATPPRSALKRHPLPLRRSGAGKWGCRPRLLSLTLSPEGRGNAGSGDAVFKRILSKHRLALRASGKSARLRWAFCLSLALEGQLAARLSPQAGKSMVISPGGRGGGANGAVVFKQVLNKHPLSLRGRGAGERVNCPPRPNRKQGDAAPR